eukprot:295051_1
MNTMNATELYETLGSYVKQLCSSNQEHRLNIAREHNLSKNESTIFFQLCTNSEYEYPSSSQTCAEIDDQLEESNKTKRKVVTFNDSEEPTAVHRKLSKLQCFEKCETPAAQSRKNVALCINGWSWAILDCIKESELHEIVKRIANLGNDLSDYIKGYNKCFLKFLKKTDIAASITKRTNDSKYHWVNSICFKFSKYDSHHKKYKKKIVKLRADIKNTITSLNIGEFDKTTNSFKEKLTYRYFSFKLRRMTTDIIPKDLFNYLMDINTQIEQQIKELKEQHTSIQTKRKCKVYAQCIAKPSTEQWRAKQHRTKIRKSNAAVYKKQGRQLKKKKEKKKGNANVNKQKVNKKEKKDTQTNCITQFFKQRKHSVQIEHVKKRRKLNQFNQKEEASDGDNNTNNTNNANTNDCLWVDGKWNDSSDDSS